MARSASSRRVLRQGDLRAGRHGGRHAQPLFRRRAARGRSSSPRHRSPSRARADILRVETGDDRLHAGPTPTRKKDRLSRMSYAAYLPRSVRVEPERARLLPERHPRRVGRRHRRGLGAGLLGLRHGRLPGPEARRPARPRAWATPRPATPTGGSYTFHFPDGNASIARLLVRSLVPGVLPGHDCRDVVTSRADYAGLDRPANPVRIRLSSICVRARNVGDPANPRGVEVAYARGGRRLPRARAKAACSPAGT